MLLPLLAAAGLPGRVEQCLWSRAEAPLPLPAPLPVLLAGVPRLVSLRLRRRLGGGPRRSAPAARRAPRARCRCSFRAWALMPAGMGGRDRAAFSPRRPFQPLQPRSAPLSPPGAPPAPGDAAAPSPPGAAHPPRLRVPAPLPSPKGDAKTPPRRVWCPSGTAKKGGVPALPGPQNSLNGERPGHGIPHLPWPRCRAGGRGDLC